MINDLFKNKKILIVAAHNDDAEFLAGGTLSKLSSEIRSGGIQVGLVTLASREENTVISGLSLS